MKGILTSPRVEVAAPEEAALVLALAAEVELMGAWLTALLGKTAEPPDLDAEEVILALLLDPDTDPELEEADVEGRVTVTLERVTGFSSAEAHCSIYAKHQLERHSQP